MKASEKQFVKIKNKATRKAGRGKKRKGLFM
jgi:hypothetical protein